MLRTAEEAQRQGYLRIASSSSYPTAKRPWSPVLVWLLACLALTLERLYRRRYLHRGGHAVRTAINLLRLLVLGLSIPVVPGSS